MKENKKNREKKVKGDKKKMKENKEDRENKENRKKEENGDNKENREKEENIEKVENKENREKEEKEENRENKENKEKLDTKGEEKQLFQDEKIKNEPITDENKENKESILEIKNYKYIYFIVKYKKGEDLILSLSNDNIKCIIEKIKEINSAQEEIIEIYYIKIEPDKIPFDHIIEIDTINNSTENKNENNKLVIQLETKIKEFYFYFSNDNKGKFIYLEPSEQFKIYIGYLNQIENNENKMDNFIDSNLYFLENNKYFFSFYILFFLEFYKNSRVEEILKLFNFDKIENATTNIEKDIIEKINILSNNPKEICINDNSKKDLYKIFMK